MILHGTTGSGTGLLSPAFAGELFGPGQPLDASRYFPERVFRAFDEAERLARWWEPHGFTNTFHASQLRAGAT